MGKEKKLKRLWHKLRRTEHLSQCKEPKCKICNEIRSVINHYSPFYVGCVFLNHKGDALLLGERNSDGIWTGPGGHADDGETPREAMVREIFEETGIPVQQEDLVDLPIMKTYNQKICHGFMVFGPKNAEPTNKNDPDREVKSWKWFPVDAQLPEPMDENRTAAVINAKMKLNGLLKAIVLNEMAPGTELNTSEYSMDAMASKNDVGLEYLENCMKDMQVNEPNREIMLGKMGNMLHISKVDDGAYSGWVKNGSQDVILRLEKMPIPSILQALRAKELMVEPASEPAPASIAEVIGEQVMDMVREKEQSEPLLPKANEGSDREELSEILDALEGFQAKEIHIHIHKALNTLETELGKAAKSEDKGGHPIGTIREHEGKKYQKLGPSHWSECINEGDSEAAVEQALKEQEAEMKEKQREEDLKQHEKNLNEIKSRLDKMAEQRAKERGQPIKDTPAKVKKDLKPVERDHKKLKAEA